MNTLSELIARDLIELNILVLFGVQGGACARIIDSFVKLGGEYVPVLNEQSAGYAAHGYYLKTNKIAGVVVTTGPGLTNAISGIASCYYDSVPILLIGGQIKSTLNHAKIFNTKMVGFQELPHLDLLKPICDASIDVRSVQDYLSQRNSLWSKMASNKSSIFMEIQDDVQREVCDISKINHLNLKPHNSFESAFASNEVINSSIVNCDLIVLGSGSKTISKRSIDRINASGIPVILSWGGQPLSALLDNYVGLFGTHTPGIGNTYFCNSKNPLVVGCSLLQHQAGRDNSLCLKKAEKIIFINIEKNEIDRFQAHFCERAKSTVMEADQFFQLFNLLKSDNNELNLIAKNTKDNVSNIQSPASFFSRLLKVFSNYGYCAFTDVGATLSWSFQGLNKIGKTSKPIKMYSSFNLHPMGFSNCALFGALKDSLSEQILAIIGDGSLPMNCQDLAHLQLSSRAKVVVLDNKGYGIIRMTQNEFYDGRFLGSDFNGVAKLPFFDIRKIVSGFGLKYQETTTKALEPEIDSFFASNNQVLIVSCDPKAVLETDFFQ